MIGDVIFFGILIAVAFWVFTRILFKHKSINYSSETLYDPSKGVFPIQKHESIPITLKDYFFTANEYKLYKILYSIINEKPEYELVSKVRWEDIWNAQKGDKEFNRYRGYLRSRHIDFVILSREQGCPIKILIELNDRSHRYQKAVERDDRLKKFCKHTKIHLMIVNSSRIYDEAKIKENLNKCIRSKVVFICEC